MSHNRIKGNNLRCSHPLLSTKRISNKGGHGLREYWKSRQQTNCEKFVGLGYSDITTPENTDVLSKEEDLGAVGEPIPSTSQANPESFSDISNISTYDVKSHSPHFVLPEISVTGRRLINFSHFWKQMQALNDHTSIFSCTINNMIPVKEVIRGLYSIITFQCTMCGIMKTVTTDDKMETVLDNVNTAAVSGTIAGGCGFAQLESVSAALELPCLSGNTYREYEKKVSKAWHKTSIEQMEIAAKEEKAIAIAKNNVDLEGTPLLKVVGDGAYLKRSYHHSNYNSLAGVAAIVGYETGKVIFMSVRNKYCTFCARAKSGLSKKKADHECSKNWTGSTTSMEADILNEAFCRSKEMYGVKYQYFIGDGDSSVFRKIQDSLPYFPDQVEKIECRNHLLRNFFNHLKNDVWHAKGLQRRGTPGLRAIVRNNVPRLRNAIVGAINYRSSQTELTLRERVSNLKSDILNCHHHVFGDHSVCAAYFCKKSTSYNYIPELRCAGLLDVIQQFILRLAHHSDSLIHNVDSNRVEHYNSIVAKFVGGKRVNYALKNSYKTRCEGAAISHNTGGKIQSAVYKSVTGSSPGIFTKKMERRRSLKNIEQARRRLSMRTSAKRKKTYFAGQDDTDYGPDAARVLSQRDAFLTSLALNAEQRNRLQQESVNQSNSELWITERRKRLTASNFGMVCAMRAKTDRAKRARQIVEGFIGNAATRWGKNKEAEALKQLAKELAIDIQPCGLFIDADKSYLAASPDGLIGEDTVVEVKCPVTALDTFSIDEAISKKKLCFLQRNNGIVSLKPQHKYMFQVQGQMHITRRRYCLFVVWTPNYMFYQKIERDDEFWTNKMEKQLEKFYMQALLPTIIQLNTDAMPDME